MKSYAVLSLGFAGVMAMSASGQAISPHSTTARTLTTPVWGQAIARNADGSIRFVGERVSFSEFSSRGLATRAYDSSELSDTGAGTWDTVVGGERCGFPGDNRYVVNPGQRTNRVLDQFTAVAGTEGQRIDELYFWVQVNANTNFETAIWISDETGSDAALPADEGFNGVLLGWGPVGAGIIAFIPGGLIDQIPDATDFAIPADGNGSYLLEIGSDLATGTYADPHGIALWATHNFRNPAGEANGETEAWLWLAFGDQVLDSYAAGLAGCPDVTPLQPMMSFMVGAGGPSCRPDFDGDGFLTGLDFDAFVVAFENGEASADYDGDGFISGLDFDAYVLDFEAGC